MRFRSALTSLVLAIILTAAWMAGAMSAESLPFHPALLDAARAPRTARIVRQAALTYAPQMSEKDREIDFIQKIALAKRLLGVGRLVESAP